MKNVTKNKLIPLKQVKQEEAAKSSKCFQSQIKCGCDAALDINDWPISGTETGSAAKHFSSSRWFERPRSSVCILVRGFGKRNNRPIRVFPELLAGGWSRW